MAEMETEDDRVVKPQDAMETDMEGIVAEPNAMAPDTEVGPENAGGGPEAMEVESAHVTVPADPGVDRVVTGSLRLQPDEVDL